MYQEKREFCIQEIHSHLLRVEPLASHSLKVRRENAKLLTPNLQNVRLYSQGGVDDFSRFSYRGVYQVICHCVGRKIVLLLIVRIQS